MFDIKKRRDQLFDLSGKTAIVTGAGIGLGRTMALYLAEFGANVAILDVNLENAKKTAEDIRGIGRKALALRADVSRPQEDREAVEKVRNEFGRVDILLNNAGINIRQMAVDVTEEAWDKIIDINLKGVFFMAQAAGKVMIEQRKGKIINMASHMALITLPKRAAYCASKGGVVQVTKLLAVEWAQYNINVNAIAPSFFVTPMNDELFADPEMKNLIYNNTPLGRPGDPNDLGGAIVYLASDASDYVTGHTLFVDGGYTAR